MKRILYHTALLALAIFVSCTKFLDVDSPSKFTAEYVFGDETEMFNAVIGIYAPMVGPYLYVGQITQSLNPNTDVEFTAVTNASTFNQANYNATPNTPAFNNIWSALYDGINRANDVIEGIENSPLYQQADKNEPSNVMHYWAEAHVLRAMYYLELVRNWGDVPYRRSSAGDREELFIGATDRDIILSDMIEDLIKVEPVLHYAAQSTLGCEGVSREFCQGLIARIALTRGGYSLRPDYNNPSARGTMKRSDDWKDYYKIAEEYAGKVISDGRHSLTRSFIELWKDECNWIVPTNDDNIFDVPAKVGGAGEYGYYCGTTIVSIKDADGANTTSHPYGYTSGALKLCTSYMMTFDKKDLRRDVTCTMFRYEDNLTQTAMAGATTTCGKWNRLWMNNPLGRGSNKGSGINYTYMRYADILLMYAEAANEIHNGPTIEAKNALKEVRRRAFDMADHTEKVEAYVDALGDKESFFQAIVNERAWEFGGEKHRAYDLARWNLYGQTIYNMYFDWQEMGYDARGITGPVPITGRFSDYPARVYWKKVPSDEPPVVEKLDWVGYDTRVDTAPAGYSTSNLFNTFVTATDGVYGPSTTICYSFRGYIDPSNNQFDPQTVPVRYLTPIPTNAISSHRGMLQNYYGY